MIIGACRVRLYLPGCDSLKAKRSRLKPLLARLRKEFNVSAAEVDLHDVWQSAEIGLAAVANNDPRHLYAQLETVLKWIEHNAPDVEVMDTQVELR
jgi:hypothetical protein